MRRATGFTMLELMAALAILCILAALALPSYHRHVIRAKRVQAQAALLRLMQQQERYFSQNNSYLAFSADSTDPDERLFQWWSGASAAQSAYEIRAEACPGQAIALCVRLRALPGTVRVAPFADSDCGTLSLTSAGDRAASGPAAQCWP